jgi:hypothetical protein
MLSKEEWYPIVYDVLIDYGDKFDTLTILATHPSRKYTRSGKSTPIWSVNYKTTVGDYSTGFGVVEIKKSELDKHIRDSKLRRLLNK